MECIINHGRERADLDSVRATSRVLKEAVVWIEELPGELEEELPLRPTVVQSTRKREITL